MYPYFWNRFSINDETESQPNFDFRFLQAGKHVLSHGCFTYKIHYDMSLMVFQNIIYDLKMFLEVSSKYLLTHNNHIVKYSIFE